MPFIALLSDFGSRDPYVGAMKGVILSICPAATIVDISHEISKFNVREGAYVLASAAPYFPDGTIFVAVVDPGVGTARRPIIIESRRAFYVGPDNGLLVLAAFRDGIKNVYHITSRRYMLPEVSRTFHGRDIFAPVAAHLASGKDPSEIGSKIKDYVKPEFARPIIKKRTVFGEVLHIDSFGNIVSNIPAGLVKKIGIKEGYPVKFRIGDGKFLTTKLCKAYSEVPIGSLLTIIGSVGFLEISVNQGNAAQELKAKVGDSIAIRY